MPSLSTLQRLEVEVGADVDPAERELRDFTRRAGDGSGGGLFGGLATAGVAAFAAIGAGAAAAGGWGLSVAMDAENASIGFETMLGSGEAAQAFLGDLQAFAATTPFEFPELRDAASRLVAVGTETSSVIPLMEALGDATSGMGTGAEGIDRAVTALTQMQQKGKVTGEEMLQLTEAGIPAWDALATVLGTDVAGAQQMVTDGLVAAPVLFEALEGRAGPAMQRLSGLMEAQSQTLGGMLSTLKDTAGLALSEAMAPVVASLTAALPQITTLLQGTLTSLGPSIGTFATGLVDLASGLLPVLAPIVGTVAEIAGSLLSTLGPVLQAIAPHLGMFAAMIGDALTDALATIGPVLPGIASGLANLLGSLIGPGAEFLEQLAPLFAELLTAVAPLLAPLSELAFTLLDALIPAVLPLIPPIIDLVTALVGTEEAAGPLITVVEALSGVIAALPTEVLTGLIFALVAFTNPAVAVAVAAGLIISEWDKIGPFLAGVVGWFADLPGMILGALGDLGGWLVNAGADLVSGLLDGIVAYIDFVWDFWTGLPGNILRAVGDLGGMLFDTGRNILVGLWNGLVDGAEWFRDGLLGFLRAILPGPVERFLGISSPSRMAAWWGEMVGEGLAQGLEGQAGRVAAGADILAGAAMPTLSPIGVSSASLAGQLSPIPYGMAGTGGTTGATVLDVSLNLDGERVARLLIDPIRGELIDAGVSNGGAVLGGLA